MKFFGFFIVNFINKTEFNRKVKFYEAITLSYFLHSCF